MIQVSARCAGQSTLRTPLPKGYGDLPGGVWNARTGKWTGEHIENPAVLTGDNSMPTVAQGFVAARYSINAYAYDRSGHRTVTPTVDFILGSSNRMTPRLMVNTPFNRVTYRELRVVNGTASDSGVPA